MITAPLNTNRISIAWTDHDDKLEFRDFASLAQATDFYEELAAQEGVKGILLTAISQRGEPPVGKAMEGTA